jgi:hypothetical protein
MSSAVLFGTYAVLALCCRVLFLAARDRQMWRKDIQEMQFPVALGSRIGRDGAKPYMRRVEELEGQGGPATRQMPAVAPQRFGSQPNVCPQQRPSSGGWRGGRADHHDAVQATRLYFFGSRTGFTSAPLRRV